MFKGIGCFRDTFPFKVKEDVNLNQAPPRHVAYTLQEPFKNKLERLQEQQILTPLYQNKTAEWCNSFVIVPQPN